MNNALLVENLTLLLEVPRLLSLDHGSSKYCTIIHDVLICVRQEDLLLIWVLRELHLAHSCNQTTQTVFLMNANIQPSLDGRTEANCLLWTTWLGRKVQRALGSISKFVLFSKSRLFMFIYLIWPSSACLSNVFLWNEDVFFLKKSVFVQNRRFFNWEDFLIILADFLGEKKNMRFV